MSAKIFYSGQPVWAKRVVPRGTGVFVQEWHHGVYVTSSTSLGNLRRHQVVFKGDLREMFADWEILTDDEYAASALVQ